MKKIAALLLLFSTVVQAQQFAPFQFYNQKGAAVKPEKMVRQLAEYDVVFFGEHHNNSVNHWLQLRVTEALFAQKNGKLILGAEMFERDNQPALDKYLSGRYSEKQLKDSARLWTNFATDYQPLLDFAKSRVLPFFATNVPRKYASKVSKEGLATLENLPVNEKKWMAKLPISVSYETPGYEEMKTMMGAHADLAKVNNFVAAQAIKDATMAESIIANIKAGYTFLHYNGDFHSKEFGGIYWYIKQKRPDLKMAVISVYESPFQNLVFPKENFIPTTFTLVLPRDITKTY